MVGRRELGSWLAGPAAARAADPADRPDPASTDGAEQYPGRRLGRPPEGPRSVAGAGRRLLALALDWALALLIARALPGARHLDSFGPLLVFGAENVLLVSTAGATIGHRIAGLRVERLDGAAPRPVQALIRAVLVCLAVPPLVWDRDQRGTHDRLAGTVLALR